MQTLIKKITEVYLNTNYFYIVQVAARHFAQREHYDLNH